MQFTTITALTTLALAAVPAIANPVPAPVEVTDITPRGTINEAEGPFSFILTSSPSLHTSIPYSLFHSSLPTPSISTNPSPNPGHNPYKPPSK